MQLRTHDDCATFVDALAHRDAAGIGLAVDANKDIPVSQISALADEHDLPVFTIPISIPFVVFTETFAQLHWQAIEAERERQENGQLLEFVRRGLASASILRERIGEVGTTKLVAFCIPPESEMAIAGPALIGSCADHRFAVLPEDRLREVLDGRSVTICGWGSPTDLEGIRQSLNESVLALRMSVKAGRVIGPRDLASFPGLVGQLSGEQLAPFRDHVLEPLKRHDAQRGTQLVATIRCFLATGGSVSETAKTLYLHENSVRKRLARVRSVTGLDPADVEDRVALMVAIDGC